MATVTTKINRVRMTMFCRSNESTLDAARIERSASSHPRFYRAAAGCNTVKACPMGLSGRAMLED
jgi:hypothetical protein